MAAQRLIGLVMFIVLAGCGTLAGPSSASAPTPADATSPMATPTPVALAIIGPGASRDKLGTQLRGEVVIDGSSTVFPISELVSHEFRAVAPNVTVRLGVSGTSGGLRKFCSGSIAIADASRPITSAEMQVCASNSVAFIELPIGYDGISLVTHPSDTWLTCLTVAELRRLWEPQAERAITSWRQVRPTFPDAPIALFGAGADSGTYDYFTEAIVGTPKASRHDYTGTEDDYITAQSVVSTPDSLGFFGYAYYRKFERQLALVAVDSGSGCVLPSAATIADGHYAPLSRPLFLYINRSALDRSEVRAFVEYYSANVARVVAASRYVPLPDDISAVIRRRLERRTDGSVFGGTPQIGISARELLALEER